MHISLIGGIDRLERHYLNEAKKLGIELKVYNRLEGNLIPKLRHSEAVILFTGKISHEARVQVMSVAHSCDIPVYMFHTCGVCTLRDCLNCLAAKSQVPAGVTRT
jgi:hypothetical protein